MNKFVITFIGSALFLMSGCGDEDQVCIMTEALVTYPPDPFLKRVFTHDGTNYTEIRDYRYDQSKKDFETTPYQIITFTYANGKVSKVSTRDPKNNDGTYRESTFTYSTVDEITIVNEHEVTYFDGVVSSDRIQEGHFIEFPRDAVYLTKNILNEPILEKYENGNLVDIGFQSKTGTYVGYDTTWAFTIHYNYDTKPNAINEAVLYDLITDVPNGGYCANNMIEAVINPNTQPISIKQQFNLKNGNKLDTYVYEGTGRTVTVSYTCR